jgi:hypothetical protein
MKDFFGNEHVPSRQTRFTSYVALQEYTTARANAFVVWAQALADELQAMGIGAYTKLYESPNIGGPLVGLLVTIPKIAGDYEFDVGLGQYDFCTVRGLDPGAWLVNSLRYVGRANGIG